MRDQAIFSMESFLLRRELSLDAVIAWGEEWVDLVVKDLRNPNMTGLIADRMRWLAAGSLIGTVDVYPTVLGTRFYFRWGTAALTDATVEHQEGNAFVNYPPGPVRTPQNPEGK